MHSIYLYLIVRGITLNELFSNNNFLRLHIYITYVTYEPIYEISHNGIRQIQP